VTNSVISALLPTIVSLYGVTLISKVVGRFFIGMKEMNKGQFQTTHGMSNTKEYHAWESMIQRCCNPKCRAYYLYGARGITMPNRWRESFQVFLDDIGYSPGPKYQFDRIDNNQGYSRENCRWVLPIVNSRNRRDMKLTIKDVQQIHEKYNKGATRKELACKYGVKPNTVTCILLGRIWKGISAR